MTEKKVCAVVGVGPGLGEAYARAFAEAGWSVALLARSAGKLEALAEELGGLAVPCDVTDDAAIGAAVDAIEAELGPIHTLVWNVGSGVFGDLDAIGVDAMELAWRTNARGLFVAAQRVVGGMREAGEGNILVTGATASLRGKPFTTAFAAGKAAQRSLCESLARQLWPEGVHVALIIVDGLVDLPSVRARMPDRDDASFVGPAETAQIALHLARQPRRAWSFQVEARPSVESW